MNNKTWDPENLNELITSTQMSNETAAEAIGIDPDVLKCFRNGDVPDMEHLIKIADYFAVPLDFLTGRCNEYQADSIIENYSRCFMELRRAPYESYLYGRDVSEEIKIKMDKYESPYPYNLVEKILEKPVDTQIREENLNKILEILPERIREALMLYYRDGLTLRAAGEKMGVSQERIRQIIQTGIMRLKHPSRKAILTDGWYSFEEIDAYAEKKLAELTVWEERLSEIDAALRIKADALSDKDNALSALIDILKTAKTNIHAALDITTNLNSLDDMHFFKSCCSIPIEDLDLSVRAYNCLKRAGVNTVEDILKKDEDEMWRIKNLGRNCIDEIRAKLRTMGFFNADFMRKVRCYCNDTDK